MDRQGSPNWPRYQLTRGVNRTRQQKRCSDVTMFRQEGSTMCHLANAHFVTRPAASYAGQLFLSFCGTGRADR